MPEQLVGRYVPNLTAKEFGLGRKYVEEVWGLTGSEVLRKVLDEVRGFSELPFLRFFFGVGEKG